MSDKIERYNKLLRDLNREISYIPCMLAEDNERMRINATNAIRQLRQFIERFRRIVDDEEKEGGEMSESPQTQICKTCKYYEWAGMNAICRRFPPKVYALHRERRDAFPMVAIDEWCGEWKAKEAK